MRPDLGEHPADLLTGPRARLAAIGRPLVSLPESSAESKVDTVVRASDVALRAGTSTATVSYVFNDGPRQVAPATRERVLQAARELGYRPNGLARALRTATSGLVGVMLPDVTTPYFAALAKDLERSLAERGKLTLLSNTEIGLANELETFEAYRAIQVDGIVVAYSDYDQGPPDVGGVPVSYLFNGPPGFDGTLVRADNDGAVRVAIDHLVGHGYDEIEMLGGLLDLGPVGERVAAWRAHIGKPAAEPLRSAFSPSDAARVMSDVFARGTSPRALVVATDEQAVGVLAAAYACDKRVPDDLGVITLDGSPSVEFTAPALSAMVQPTAPLADNAVKALFGEAFESLVPAHLEARASCGC